MRFVAYNCLYCKFYNKGCKGQEIELCEWYVDFEALTVKDRIKRIINKIWRAV